MSDIGRSLISLGVIILVVGGIVALSENFGLHLGRLPGDFTWQVHHVKLYVPLTTCLLISVTVSLAMFLIDRILR